MVRQSTLDTRWDSQMGVDDVVHDGFHDGVDDGVDDGDTSRQSSAAYRTRTSYDIDCN